MGTQGLSESRAVRISDSRDMATDIRTDTAFAVQLAGSLDNEGLPPERAWETAPPVSFCADWQGKNADRQRETQVRLLWNADFLFLRFDARYRGINVFADAEPSGRRDGLWDRDVCEVFLQPRGSHPDCYKEIEVAPNGLWVDLEIAPGEKRDLRSGLRQRVNIDEAQKQWQAVLAVPMKSLIARFEMPAVWRVNFFRVEGAEEPRFYSAWRPTNTPAPNFHVPEAFGALVFTESGGKIGA
jgi:alpha-galactosidase